ncbi:MAG: hypothetical protein LUC17_02065, partial [Oscillospiraceae bacterium]|nr:hypothetical protein [Oscillospiraceae bacterium]
LWDYAKRISPNFQNHTGKLTYEEFASKGFEAIQYTGGDLINEWFGTILMPVLNVINISHAKDPLEEKGFGETYDMPNGGVIQRMAVNSILPMSPSYTGLKNGDSVDPFVVYKPEVSDRFYQMNFDYQAMITVQDYQIKQIFASEYGMSELMAGIMEGLRNAYTIQKYENKLEAINAGINSEKYPFKDSQKVTLKEWQDAPTDENLMEFISDVKNVIAIMETLPQYDGFNAAGFASTQDVSRLKLLVRSDIPIAIQLQLRVGAYNPEDLTLPVDIIGVSNFGGLEAYKDAAFSTKLYPVYDTLGHCIGYNETEGSDTVTVEKSAAYMKDPNADVLALLADKGWIFESIQNPYTVEPIRNPRGIYNNYFANSPNNAINVDSYYNAIVFTK